MTREEFTELMTKLLAVYPNFRINDSSVQAIWWEKFSDMRFDYSKIAVDRYMDSERFAPTPADIITRYHEVEERQKARMRDLREIFEFCHSCYPTNLWGENDWLRFKEKISSAKFQDALLKAEMIKRHILNDRITGDKPFADYIWEVEV